MNAAHAPEQLEKIDSAFSSLLEHIRNAFAAGNDRAAREMIPLAGDLIEFYQEAWGMNMNRAFGELLSALRQPADILMASARVQAGRGCPGAARHLAEIAAGLSDDPRHRAMLYEFMRQAGEVEQSRMLSQEMLRQTPASHAAMSELFMCDVAERFWKQDYYRFFSSIHTSCPPRTYIEIGVATGRSIALARSGTHAIGIDPALAESGGPLFHSPENTPHFYGMTSDDFFNSLDLQQEMGQPCFDLAFIDGLHHFDQVLRDFINLERYAGEQSLIMIHDCLPIDPRVAERERDTAFWTGDVWKIIPCLRATRPDLEIITLPVPPAGLALVRRLNPSSTILRRQYRAVEEQFNALSLPQSWEERCALLAVETSESSFHIENFLPKGGWQ